MNALVSVLRQEAQLLIVAIQFLTRLPVPALANYQAAWLNQSARYFPLVGLLVGGLTASIFALLFTLFNPWIAALGSTAFSVRLTGAFHEDGLADTCDGLGGGLTPEHCLAIMKDSRLGTYGTLGLGLTLALKVALLASLPLDYAILALIIAQGTSRFFSLLPLHYLPYAGDPEHAKAKPLALSLTQGQVFFALLLCVPAFALGLRLAPWPLSSWLLSLTLMSVTGYYMMYLLRKKLGGFTGDGLGATQQLTELAFYFGVAALWL